jgi:uridine kinase
VKNAPLAKVVLLTGPSGCGKTRVTKRVGLPVLQLDDFYFDYDHPGLPQRFGIVDWDDAATWDIDGAFNAVKTLCETGEVEVPDYDIPTSSRVGSHVVHLGDAKIIIAEGIFAAELIERCKTAGLLADAICLRRRRMVSFWFRLVRDLHEGRKPVFTLIKRGIGLFRQEPELFAAWSKKGCRLLGLKNAEASIKSLCCAD